MIKQTPRAIAATATATTGYSLTATYLLTAGSFVYYVLSLLM